MERRRGRVVRSVPLGGQARGHAARGAFHHPRWRRVRRRRGPAASAPCRMSGRPSACRPARDGSGDVAHGSGAARQDGRDGPEHEREHDGQGGLRGRIAMPTACSTWPATSRSLPSIRSRFIRSSSMTCPCGPPEPLPSNTLAARRGNVGRSDFALGRFVLVNYASYCHFRAWRRFDLRRCEGS